MICGECEFFGKPSCPSCLGYVLRAGVAGAAKVSLGPGPGFDSLARHWSIM
jgi:hypothetical protein